MIIGFIVSIMLNIILVGEKLFSWTPWAKRAKLRSSQVVKRVNGNELRVPWHRVRFDAERNRYVIPDWGTTTLDKASFELAKRENSGWFMEEISPMGNYPRNYIPTNPYPL